jgi:hypothetical protein
LAEIVILDLGRISTEAVVQLDIQVRVETAEWALVRPLLLLQEAMAKAVVVVVALGDKAVAWVYTDKGPAAMALQ